MVGAGELIVVLSAHHLPYITAEIIVGILMIVYVAFGGMKATTWVQIIKAGLLLFGATVIAAIVLTKFSWSPTRCSPRPSSCLPRRMRSCPPGGFVPDPISGISLGMALMFGTAGLPHILMRFFTVKDAKTARTSVLYATGFIGYFYVLTFIIGFGAIVFDLKGTVSNMAAVRLAEQVGGPTCSGSSRGRVRDDPRGCRRPDAGGGLRRQPRHLRQRHRQGNSERHEVNISKASAW